MRLNQNAGKPGHALFLLLAGLFFLPAFCGAQEEKPAFVLRPWFIRKDTAWVDQLNDKSYACIVKEQKDSAVFYAGMAHQEALRLDYPHGVAVALSRQSQIAKHFDDDFVQSERLGKAALTWFDRTPNKSGLDTLYNAIIYTVFAQSRFEEALEFTRKRYAFARRVNNLEGVYNALGWMFGIYRQSGNYEKSFEHARNIFEIALRSSNKIWISRATYSMAQLYMLIEDYPQALHYFRKVLQMDDKEVRAERVLTDNDIWFKMEFTEVFSRLGQFDSAWHYYRLFRPDKDKSVYMRVYWISTGECAFLQKNYKLALRHFKLGLAEHQRLNDHNEVMRAALDLGKTYLALDMNAKAVAYGRQGLAMALQTKSKQYIRDGCLILSTVYDRLNQSDSANYYFRQYAHMKEEVLGDQARGKLAAYKYEQQIAAIHKEKEIQQVRLQKESFAKKVLIAGLVLLVLLGVLVIRTGALKRRNEKQQLVHEITLQKMESEWTKAEFEKRSADLKMEALRAQMNPHFIFNSLNSINHFILRNNKAQASEYLIKFSRLVRLILQNSQQPLIPLESELEALRLYLELEALRFDDAFDYTILVGDEVDVSLVLVPPLIIQPYAENAIWHGLMNKKERGSLLIRISMEEDVMSCTISDNGVGRKKAAELKSKSASVHKSMGITITEDRIALLHRNKGREKGLTITDLVAADGSGAGTEVTLKIAVPYDQSHPDR